MDRAFMRVHECLAYGDEFNWFPEICELVEDNAIGYSIHLVLVTDVPPDQDEEEHKHEFWF